MSKHSKSKHSKQEKKLTKDVGQVLDKLVNPIVTDKKIEAKNPITVKRIIKSNEADVIVNENSEGQLVLTQEDNDKIEALKALQANVANATAKERQARIDKKEAFDKAKEALQSLSGSEAIKAILADIEKREAEQQKAVDEATEVRDWSQENLQAKIEALQAIQAERYGLTGFDKIVKASKSKAGNGQSNGKFDTAAIKVQADGSLSILVTHKATKSLFEYSLYPKNGTISHEAWLKLRHGLTAQFEKDTAETNLTIRAYLSNLKSKIEAVKAIA